MKSLTLFKKRVKSRTGDVIWTYPYQFTWFGFILFDKRYVNRFLSFKKQSGLLHLFGFRMYFAYGSELENERKSIIRGNL